MKRKREIVLALSARKSARGGSEWRERAAGQAHKATASAASAKVDGKGDEEDDDEGLVETPSDCLLALKMLLGESPKVTIPGGKRLRIILQHSLYTLLNSKTEADQGVLKLIRKGVLMRLHSPCDGAIILVLKSEYRAYVSHALKGSMTRTNSMHF